MSEDKKLLTDEELENVTGGETIESGTNFAAYLLGTGKVMVKNFTTNEILIYADEKSFWNAYNTGLIADFAATTGPIMPSKDKIN